MAPCGVLDIGVWKLTAYLLSSTKRLCENAGADRDHLFCRNMITDPVDAKVEGRDNNARVPRLQSFHTSVCLSRTALRSAPRF